MWPAPTTISFGGAGITYLPAFAVSRQLRRGEVHAIPLTDAPLAHVPSRIVVRSGRPRTGAVRAVADLMARHMEAFGAEAG